MLTVVRLLGAALAAAVAVGLPGCGGDDDGAPPPAAAPPTAAADADADAGRYRAAFEGLCAARAAAGTDVNQARTTFYDRSHDPLHSLAGDLEPVDRALAARLLEAKEAVESGVRADPPPPSLEADLDRLREVTGQALARLQHPAPACP